MPRDEKVVGLMVESLALLGAVWPGFGWADRCIVLNRQPSAKANSSYHYVIGHPGLDASYTKIPYAEADVRFKAGALPDAAAFSYPEIQGRPGFFANLSRNLDPQLGNPKSKRDPYLAMTTFCIHEMFHAHQRRLPRPTEPATPPFEQYLDPENVTLAILECEAAAAYGRGTITAESAARDILAIRRRRQRQYGDSVRNDAYTEAIEGTPYFVEHNLLLALGANADADAFTAGQCEWLERQPDFDMILRNRAYPFGALVCRMPRDKLGAVSDDYFVKTPVGLLAEVYGFSASELDTRFDELRAGASAKAAEAKAARCLEHQRAEMQRARELFDGALPRVILPRMSGFSAGDIIMFPGDLWVGKFTFYNADKDQRAKLRLENETHLGVSLESMHLQRIPEDAKLFVDGGEARPLAFGADIAFRDTLRMAGPGGFELTFAGGGVLRTSPNQTLVYVPNQGSSFREPMTAAAYRFAKPTALAQLQRDAMPILSQ